MGARRDRAWPRGLYFPRQCELAHACSAQIGGKVVLYAGVAPHPAEDKTEQEIRQ
jgi:hypothetical protein